MEGSCHAGWRGSALGPWSAGATGGEEAKASIGILAGLENTGELHLLSGKEELAGKSCSSPFICPVLSKHQLIFLTLPEDKEALECRSGQSVKTTTAATCAA